MSEEEYIKKLDSYDYFINAFKDTRGNEKAIKQLEMLKNKLIKEWEN